MLSVVVRSGPVVTAVNGTLVARLARMTWHTLAPSVHRDRRVRPVLGDYCLVGKPPKVARQDLSSKQAPPSEALHLPIVFGG